MGRAQLPLCKYNVNIKLAIMKTSIIKILVWESTYDFCIWDLSKNGEALPDTKLVNSLSLSPLFYYYVLHKCYE